MEHTEIRLATNAHLPVDSTGIPTTTTPTPHPSIPNASGLNHPFTLGATAPDIDDCFVLSPDTTGAPTIDTRAQPLRKLVAAYHPQSKIHLEVWSTEPAFQFYTGKYVDLPAIGGLPARGPRAGFCVEPSRYVNAPNVGEWREQVLLRRGEVYGSRIVYKAWKE